MKNGYKLIVGSQWFRICLLLAFTYSSQAFSLHHSIHSHEESSIEIASTLSEDDLEHSLYHHHPDETLPRNDDHQHTYDEHINWHVIRAQFRATSTVNDSYALSFTSLSLTDDTRSIYCDLEQILFLKEYHASYTISRGPPLLG